jgi:DNA repair and recombination RAD54-like protein
MLRRAPTTADGQVIDRSSESSRVFKPFKKPTLVKARELPARKRKRVSYKGADTENADDSDDDSPAAKRRKAMRDGPPPPRPIEKMPKFDPKPWEEVSRKKYEIPSMRDREGNMIRRTTTAPPLGARAQAVLLPRPLHDPMADHAIVLYDPTIDARETDEERRAREAEAAKEKAAKDAAERNVGLFNPHKSLKEMLGGVDKKKRADKVPVVIDPVLAKVLRPHQIEGVKVCGAFAYCVDRAQYGGSFSIARRRACWSMASMVALWRTRWASARRCNA